MIQRRNYAVIGLSCASLGVGLTLGIAPPDLSFLQGGTSGAGAIAQAGLLSGGPAGGLPSFLPPGALAPPPGMFSPVERPEFGPTTQTEAIAPAYNVYDLGPLDGKVRLLPVSLNNRGEILASRIFLTERMLPRKRDGVLRQVGYRVIKREGIFFNSSREPFPIPALPGCSFVAPTALNNQGKVVGVCGSSDPFGQLPDNNDPLRIVKVFSWQNGKQSDLNLVERAKKSGFIIQDGLSRLLPNSLLFNDQEHLILQLAQNGNNMGTPPVTQTFLFQGDKVKPLYPANYRWLNNKGILLGRYGEIFAANSPTINYLFDLQSKASAALPPLVESPRAFNDAQQVLCVETIREASGVRSAFRVWEKGHLKPCVTLDAPIGPIAMNNQGHIAGFVESGQVGTIRLPGPYLHRDGKLYDLNNAISKGSASWQILDVYNLNDRDEMLAMASRADGHLRAVLLRPK